jgi:hypothetical protein
MCDINSFYDELENDLDEKTKEIIEKVKDKIENDLALKSHEAFNFVKRRSCL